jgi:hypothetical protein
MKPEHNYNPQYKTPQRLALIEKVYELWLTGLNASQVAAKINTLRLRKQPVNRNVVIGIVNRKRLKLKQTGETGAYPERTVLPKVARPPDTGKVARARPQPAPIPALVLVRGPLHAPLSALQQPKSRSVLMMHTTDTGCRYITDGCGEHALFCEAGRKDKSSYCEYHHSICYTVEAKPRMKVSRYAR